MISRGLRGSNAQANQDTALLDGLARRLTTIQGDLQKIQEAQAEIQSKITSIQQLDSGKAKDNAVAVAKTEVAVTTKTIRELSVVTERLATILEQSGIGSVQTLASTPIENLVAIKGIGEKTATTLLQEAQDALIVQSVATDPE